MKILNSYTIIALFLTLSNKVKKCLCIYLYICLSVRTLTLLNILQMSSNLYVLFISDIAWTVLKNGMHKSYDSSTKTYKSFPIHCDLCGRKLLKCILTFLYCNKCSKINLCHLDIHKHVSYKKWYKYYKYFVYSLTKNISNPMGENFWNIFQHIYIELTIIKIMYAI